MTRCLQLYRSTTTCELLLVLPVHGRCDFVAASRSTLIFGASDVHTWSWIIIAVRLGCVSKLIVQCEADIISMPLGIVNTKEIVKESKCHRYAALNLNRVVAGLGGHLELLFEHAEHAFNDIARLSVA